MRETACSHTGSSLTADGSTDHLVKPGGVASYTVPNVGTPAEYADFRDMPYDSDAQADDDGDDAASDDGDDGSSSSSVVGDSCSSSDEESSDASSGSGS